LIGRIFRFAASPMLEVERRQFLAAGHGDTRVAFSWVATLCKHCGID